MGSPQVAVEIVTKISDVKILALDSGESRGVILDVILEGSAVEGFELEVTQAVEAEDAEDGEETDGQQAK